MDAKGSFKEMGKKMGLATSKNSGTISPLAMISESGVSNSGRKQVYSMSPHRKHSKDARGH